MRREKVRNGSPAFFPGKKSKVRAFSKDSVKGKTRLLHFPLLIQGWKILCIALSAHFLHFNLHKSRRHVPSATRNVLLCCHFSDQGLQERLLVMAANQEYGITTRDLARSPHQTKLKVCQLKSRSWKGLCCPRFGSAWAALMEEDLNGFWHVLMVCVTFFIFSPGHG